MSKKEIVIESPEEKRFREELQKKDDPESNRLKRYLSMPDLSRTPGNPLHEIAKRIVAIPDFKGFELLKVPEIVSVKESFDPFNFPQDHPARSTSDTYYVDENHILRPHTTVMWSYHLALPEVKEKMEKGKSVGALCHGKVYRKDEIDRRHMNVFHQIDGWYLTKKEDKEIGLEELKDVLSKIAKSIYGEDIKYRFNKDQFPYTDPSLEMEVEINGQWIEVLGSGVVHSQVLENFGVDSSVWNGWAFGFGLERLAILSMELPDIRLLWSDDERVKRQLKLGNKYQEVSKFPPAYRDISFVVGEDFVLNDYFDAVRDVAEDMIEEMEQTDKYENEEKFGKGKTSYTFRITYRHLDRTLTSDEVNKVHAEIEELTKRDFGGELRE